MKIVIVQDKQSVLGKPACLAKHGQAFSIRLAPTDDFQEGLLIAHANWRMT